MGSTLHEPANGFVDPSVMCSLCCLLSLQDYIWEKNDMILYSSEHTFLQLFRTFGIFFGPSMRGRPCAHHVCGIPCLLFFADLLPPSPSHPTPNIKTNNLDKVTNTNKCLLFKIKNNFMNSLLNISNSTINNKFWIFRCFIWRINTSEI